MLPYMSFDESTNSSHTLGLSTCQARVSSGQDFELVTPDLHKLQWSRPGLQPIDNKTSLTRYANKECDWI